MAILTNQCSFTIYPLFRNPHMKSNLISFIHPPRVISLCLHSYMEYVMAAACIVARETHEHQQFAGRPDYGQHLNSCLGEASRSSRFTNTQPSWLRRTGFEKVSSWTAACLLVSNVQFQRFKYNSFGSCKLLQERFMRMLLKLVISTYVTSLDNMHPSM